MIWPFVRRATYRRALDRIEELREQRDILINQKMILNLRIEQAEKTTKAAQQERAIYAAVLFDELFNAAIPKLLK